MSFDDAQDQDKSSKVKTEFQELIQRVQDGDEEAARRLYDKWSPYILKIIRCRFLEPNSILRRVMDSDDFLQETFCSTFEGIIQGGQFVSQQAFINYVLTIAERRSQEAYRFHVTTEKRSLERLQALDPDKHEVPASNADPARTVLAQDELQQVLASVPGQYRELLLTMGDKTQIADIAERTGISLRHAQRLYRHARRRYAPQFPDRTEEPPQQFAS